jgi:hypothetical protein
VSKERTKKPTGEPAPRLQLRPIDFECPNAGCHAVVGDVCRSSLNRREYHDERIDRACEAIAEALARLA